ncbi:MAG: NAD(P)H-dependent glycerol-3-phosphate dehydrogenase [Polyangiales bacterium]
MGSAARRCGAKVAAHARGGAWVWEGAAPWRRCSPTRVTRWGCGVGGPELAAAIRADAGERDLPSGARFADTLRPTSVFPRRSRARRWWWSQVPTHGLREVLRATWRPVIPLAFLDGERDQGDRAEHAAVQNEITASEVAWSEKTFVALLGPSRKEVAAGQPTVVVAASRDLALAEEVQRAFWTDDRFRVYLSEDVVGVELGGALKNVVAIAAGASDGLGFGHNARAALITRGLSEMARLAMKMGGDALTLAGLAGMGDLVLTCTGELSRNRYVGFELGKGRTLSEVLGEMRQVAEGVRTARSARELAQREGVSMPITEMVFQVLYHDKPLREAVHELMVREARMEL